MITEKQKSYMRWAIALALEGQGRTSPNPMVGAVIVKGDRIVGEGYHRKAGTPHAEIHALREAGKRAKGAELYVTLEPCAHYGRTPPCVPAIAAAGIKRVFVGCRDLNSIVNGRGIRELKRTGIEVIEGVLGVSCAEMNAAYNKFIVSGIPFVTAKVALSLDGKIATSNGDSRWITNEDCREYVHRLRAQSDAVVVGGGTARSDDPRLNVRIKGARGLQPRAVIIDENLSLPRAARIFRRPKGSVIIATTVRAKPAMRKWIESKGHTVIRCRATGDGRVFLPHMLRELGKIGITSILVEGGGQLFSDFFKRKLVDRVVVCIAPKLIGGRGMDFLPGIEIARMKETINLEEVSMQLFGDNVVVEGVLNKR